MEPLAREQLEPVLRVIEAAQSLASGDDVPEMLASLSRQLTEFLGASACLVSVVDAERGVVRDRAGYARPPHRWEAAAEEYALADYPRTEAVLRTGVPYRLLPGCRADRSRRGPLADGARLPLAADAVADCRVGALRPDRGLRRAAAAVHRC